MHFPDSWLTGSRPYVSLKGWIACLIGFIILLLVIGGAFTAVITISSRNCAYSSHRYHRPTHYDWLAGCYISVGNGESISIERYNGFRNVK